MRMDDNDVYQDIVEKTEGQIIYQEQIMRLVSDLARAGMDTAEKVRKLVSKSKLEELLEYQEKFIEGCVKEGISPENAQEIWKSIESAGRYSFNKSHAVEYSVVTYHCAWMKQYYPKEFLTAVLQVEAGEVFMRAISELKDLGINVRLPDINLSREKASILSDGDVILGLSDVDNVGKAALADIIAKQPYSSFTDFMDRRDTRVTNVRVIRNLISAGAFDYLGERDKLYYTVTPDEIPKQWDEKERVLKQTDVLDYPPDTPLIDYFVNPFKNDVDITSLGNIDWEDVSEEMYVHGVILSLKSKDTYSILHLNDGTGVVEILLGEEQRDRFDKILKKDTGTPIMAKVHMVEGRNRLYGDMILDLSDEPDNHPMEISYVKDGRDLDHRHMLNSPFNVEDKIGVVLSANYFVSKNNNKGCRIVFRDGSRYMCFNELSEPIIAGEILKYRITKDPFIFVVERQ